MDEKNKRQQIIVRISCVIAAFALWLYISNIENPINDVRLSNIPVKLLNSEVLEQSKLAIISQKDLTVTLTLRGKASDIALVKPSQFVVTVDLSTYVLHKGINTVPVQLVEAPNDQNVKIINTDTMYVKINLDEFIEKSVPITIKTDNKVKSGYYALKPQFKPTEAVIRGPANNVNKVESVVAKYNIKDAEHDIIATIPIQATDAAGNVIDEVKLNPQFIDLVIPIEKIKEVGIKVNTKGNIDKNINLKSLLPEKEKIKIAAKDEILSKLDKLDTEPIDLSKINDSGVISIPLIVPEGVTVLEGDGKVNIKVDIDKTVKKSFNCPIEVKNIGDSLKYMISVTEAKITVSGSENSINSLKNTDIKCFLDLNLLGEGEFNLPITVNVPEKVNLVSQEPALLKVVLTKEGE